MDGAPGKSWVIFTVASTSLRAVCGGESVKWKYLAGFDTPIDWDIAMEQINNQAVDLEVELAGLCADAAAALDNDGELFCQVHREDQTSSCGVSGDETWD